jgi:uncharacterized metal-binding protein YceD (DUF177 family)
MNKLAKASIVKGRTLSFSQDSVFAGYPLSYPICQVQKAHYDVKITRIGDYVVASYRIKATLLVADSRDNVPFSKTFSVQEDVDVLEEEDTAGEGFLVSGNEIDLEELALRVLVSSLPIRLVRSEKAPLPKSGKGFRVLSEDDYAKEKEEAGDPRLAGLVDFKPKD